MAMTREDTGALPVVPDVRRGRRQTGTAEVALWVDPGEHSRRAALGLGALDRHGVDMFNALLRLPVGSWVPAERLAGFELELVLQTRGLVEWDGDRVVRRAMPPTDPVVASVTYPSWRQALRTAGQFAPYCSRRIVIPARPADDSELLLEAAYWGVGVRVMGSDGQAEELACEAPFRAQRYTGASWHFAEHLYARFLSEPSP